ncbi:MAG: nucleotidyltransferase substrate binding protein [Candidatus Margulisbacteria bacterium]|nr:nucleotidyltransferase substrate binding protein [Candidatus Margulisiibacteriota bacterium]
MELSRELSRKKNVSGYQKALRQLDTFVDKGRDLSEMEKMGLIKTFENTYELGWNTIKDYLKYQGYTGIAEPRDVIRQGFKDGLISDGEGWYV